MIITIIISALNTVFKVSNCLQISLKTTKIVIVISANYYDDYYYPIRKQKTGSHHKAHTKQKTHKIYITDKNKGINQHYDDYCLSQLLKLHIMSIVTRFWKIYTQEINQIITSIFTKLEMRLWLNSLI